MLCLCLCLCSAAQHVKFAAAPTAASHCALKCRFARPDPPIPSVSVCIHAWIRAGQRQTLGTHCIPLKVNGV